MRKSAIVEGFEYDIYLLFEHFTVGLVIRLGAGNSEGVDLPVMVASTYSEKDPARSECLPWRSLRPGATGATWGRC